MYVLVIIVCSLSHLRVETSLGGLTVSPSSCTNFRQKLRALLATHPSSFPKALSLAFSVSHNSYLPWSFLLHSSVFLFFLQIKKSAYLAALFFCFFLGTLFHFSKERNKRLNDYSLFRYSP